MPLKQLTAWMMAPLLPLISNCSKLDVVNAVNRIYPATAQPDIAYGNHPRQRLDLYLPRQPEHGSDANTPVVMFFYGGSWNRGERADYAFVGRRLAALGYIVAIPDYRLYPEVAYPEFLRDCASATAHVNALTQTRAYASYAPAQQLILMGHSAGAYNAAMLALDPQWLQSTTQQPPQVAGWIGIAGPYDLYPVTNPDVKPVFHHPHYPPQSNPIEFELAGAPPALILAPAEDDLVDIEDNSIALARRLKQSQQQVKLKTIDRTDHETIIGTLSPLLPFSGNIAAPIHHFVTEIRSSQRK